MECPVSADKGRSGEAVTITFSDQMQKSRSIRIALSRIVWIDVTLLVFVVATARLLPLKEYSNTILLGGALAILTTAVLQCFVFVRDLKRLKNTCTQLMLNSDRLRIVSSIPPSCEDMNWEAIDEVHCDVRLWDGIPTLAEIFRAFSRPAYCYFELRCADGRSVLLPILWSHRDFIPSMLHDILRLAPQDTRIAVWAKNELEKCTAWKRRHERLMKTLHRG